MLFIDPTCEHCVYLLGRAKDAGLNLSVLYFVTPQGGVIEEAAIQAAVRDTFPEHFAQFVAQRHENLGWFAGWQTWKKTAEQIGLNQQKIEAALPEVIKAVLAESELARQLGVPATPALWDGKVLRVGNECLNDYLKNRKTL